MLEKTPFVKELKDRWQFLRSRRPGERFQRFYRHRREACPGEGRRWRLMGYGLLTMALGVIMLPAPGPGTVVLLVGIGLIAQASLTVARACDWAEIRMRRFAGRCYEAWHRPRSGSDNRRPRRKPLSRRSTPIKPVR
jgi:hypothetical protein